MNVPEMNEKFVYTAETIIFTFLAFSPAIALAIELAFNKF